MVNPTDEETKTHQESKMDTSGYLKYIQPEKPEKSKVRQLDVGKQASQKRQETIGNKMALSMIHVGPSCHGKFDSQKLGNNIYNTSAESTATTTKTRGAWG